MKIKNIEFICSINSINEYPPPICPEIAFVGRSNVGKSSLINYLTGRKNLARISSAPGKTRTLNFFRINGVINFVDFPGYGYARVSKKEKLSWKKLVEAYLKERDVLKLVILLRDVSIPESPYDEQMKEWLKYYYIPVIDTYTKLDKLNSKEKIKKLNYLHDKHGEQFLMISCKTGEGIEKLWSCIRRILENKKTLSYESVIQTC